MYYDIITDLAASPGITSSWFITDPGFAGMFMVDGNTIDLNLTAVPEPATWIGGVVALGFVVWTQRRRLRMAFA